MAGTGAAVKAELHAVEPTWAEDFAFHLSAYASSLSLKKIGKILMWMRN